MGPGRVMPLRDCARPADLDAKGPCGVSRIGLAVLLAMKAEQQCERSSHVRRQSALLVLPGENVVASTVDVSAHRLDALGRVSQQRCFFVVEQLVALGARLHAREQRASDRLVHLARIGPLGAARRNRRLKFVRRHRTRVLDDDVRGLSLSKLLRFTRTPTRGGVGGGVRSDEASSTILKAPVISNTPSPSKIVRSMV